MTGPCCRPLYKSVLDTRIRTRFQSILPTIVESNRPLWQTQPQQNHQQRIRYPTKTRSSRKQWNFAPPHKKSPPKQLKAKHHHPPTIIFFRPFDLEKNTVLFKTAGVHSSNQYHGWAPFVSNQSCLYAWWFNTSMEFLMICTTLEIATCNSRRSVWKKVNFVLAASQILTGRKKHL